MSNSCLILPVLHDSHCRFGKLQSTSKSKPTLNLITYLPAFREKNWSLITHATFLQGQHCHIIQSFEEFRHPPTQKAIVIQSHPLSKILRRPSYPIKLNAEMSHSCISQCSQLLKKWKQSADAKNVNKVLFTFFQYLGSFPVRAVDQSTRANLVRKQLSSMKVRKKIRKKNFFCHILLMKLHKKYAVHSPFRNYVHSSFHKRKRY